MLRLKHDIEPGRAVFGELVDRSDNDPCGSDTLVRPAADATMAARSEQTAGGNPTAAVQMSSTASRTRVSAPHEPLSQAAHRRSRRHLLCQAALLHHRRHHRNLRSRIARRPPPHCRTRARPRRPPRRARRVHHARLPQRTHRPHPGRGCSRPDRFANALSGQDRRPATRRRALPPPATDQTKVGGADRASRSWN